MTTSIKNKRITTIEEQRAFCDICDEELEYKFAFAEEHMKKYPTHRRYRTEPRN